jgi:hypothetical protein
MGTQGRVSAESTLLSPFADRTNTEREIHVQVSLQQGQKTDTSYSLVDFHISAVLGRRTISIVLALNEKSFLTCVPDDVWYV